jgi:hypothetical protein
MAFIIFLFYANLFMGEFERSGAQRKSMMAALEDIFTPANFAIALVASFIGHAFFGFLRKKF